MRKKDIADGRYVGCLYRERAKATKKGRLANDDRCWSKLFDRYAKANIRYGSACVSGRERPEAEANLAAVAGYWSAEEAEITLCGPGSESAWDVWAGGCKCQATGSTTTSSTTSTTIASTWQEHDLTINSWSQTPVQSFLLSMVYGDALQFAGSESAVNCVGGDEWDIVVSHDCDDGVCNSGAGPGGSCGDPTNDGLVTEADALAALLSAVGITSDCPLATCDVNNDGNATAIDALMLLKYAVGVDEDLDCSSGEASPTQFYVSPTVVIAGLSVGGVASATGGSPDVLLPFELVTCRVSSLGDSGVVLADAELRLDGVISSFSQLAEELP